MKYVEVKRSGAYGIVTSIKRGRDVGRRGNSLRRYGLVQLGPDGPNWWFALDELREISQEEFDKRVYET